MSREWEIDCEIRGLFGKLVRQTITAEERARLNDLQRERVRRMMPRSLAKPPQHP
jgi:hypothetical protein